MKPLSGRSRGLRFVERPSFAHSPLLLASSDEEERGRGSAGGVVTALMRQLFESRGIATALDFHFTGRDLFEPRLIHSFSDYSFSGSVYHAVDLPGFLREHLEDIAAPVFVTCLPCEVKAVRKLLGDRGIDAILVALVCSNQLTREATYHLLAMNDIDPDRIESFRYRGGGWPSGVQIRAGGEDHFFHNNSSEWTHIFHAHAFSLDKCYGCADTFGLGADLTVGDPWLSRMEGEERGASLVIPHTERGLRVVEKAVTAGAVEALDVLTDADVIESQRFTLNKKRLFRQYRPLIRAIRSVLKRPFYARLLRNPRYLRFHYKKVKKVLDRFARRVSDGEYHERHIESGDG
jgi:coenzyme F420 hydrogenase subunit beta